MSDYVNRKEIEEEGILEGVLTYRPIFAIAFAFLVALFLFYVHSTATIILGSGVVILCVIALTLVKEKNVVEFYSDACIVYDPLDETKARQVKYEDIKEWTVDSGERKLYLIMNDGEILEQETFRYEKAYTLLKKVMPEKKVKPKFRTEKKDN